MKSRELFNLGFRKGPALKAAQIAAGVAARNGFSKQNIRLALKEVLEKPDSYIEHAIFGATAKCLATGSAGSTSTIRERETPAPWRQWGDDLDWQSVQQLRNACRLPVSVAGALMPDAHVGYGLPIGGVLATRNAAVPFAVGVDIACRMKLTVLDIPVNAIKGQTDRLIGAIEAETRFGIGAKFTKPREHAVMDNDWNITPVTRQYREKARSQLGTSGSGNHFVEFGVFSIARADLGLQPDKYLALMSHSGSRGTGAQVASHYSRIAMELHPELPKELRHLAWLDLDSHAGQEYWQAMNLMGEYASANHAVIHREIARHLGADVLADIENHHNFAWKERHEIPGTDGGVGEVIVHRKGATPAGKGVLGVIPGSMASPAYIVRGKGNAASLESASHGAGRIMSRTAAKKSISWSDARKLLKDRDVHVISCGIDEVPFVYKDIDEVMSYQDDLVEIVARFDPRIVKMAPAGERPED